MCAIDDCEPCQAYYDDDRRAAKPHRCGECNRDIAKGETYRYSKTLSDGKWSANKTCSHCMVGQRWLSINCGGWLFSQVAEEMWEHAEEYPLLAVPLLRVKIGMQRKWKRFDGAGLMALPRLPPSIESLLARP